MFLISHIDKEEYTIKINKKKFLLVNSLVYIVNFQNVYYIVSQLVDDRQKMMNTDLE